MTDSVAVKIQKLFDGRLKAETELKEVQNEIVDAVNNSERRVRVERLVTYCDELVSKAFSKNEQLLELAKKTNDPASTSADLEKWLHETTVNNEEILKRAREYIGEQPQSEKLSQNSRKTTTVRTKSSKASSSKLSKTSSQRQRDLIIAQQRREEIEKQNEASLRLVRQKQELKLERQELEIEKMREEQERLRNQQERLRKEQELRVLELEEENRKRLAEATLAELELREDLSELHVDFHDTLSRVSAASRRAETERINEWINNSPNVAENNIQSTNEAQVKSAPNGTLNTYTPVPLPQTVENQAIAEAITTTTGATGGLILTASVPQTLPSTPPVPIVQQVAPPTGSPAGVPAVSVAPLTIPMTSSTTTTRITNVLNQTTPHLLSISFNPTVSVPVSHVLPNLSAWTIPPVTSSLPTQPRILLPSSHPMITATTRTSVGSTPVTTMPVMPVTHGGTVFYVPPSAVTVPTPIPTNVQPSSSFPSATAAPFIPSGSSAVLQPSTTHFSVQDVAQLLASTKKDHLPEWKLSEYNGDPIHWHEWFGQFKSAIDSAQLSDDVKLTYLKTLVTGKAKVAIAEIAYCGATSRTPSRLLS